MDPQIRPDARYYTSVGSSTYCLVAGQLQPCVLDRYSSVDLFGDVPGPGINAGSNSVILQVGSGRKLAARLGGTLSPTFAAAALRANLTLASDHSAKDLSGSLGVITRSGASAQSLASQAASVASNQGATLAIWEGGNGTWSPGNWSCFCVPNGSGYDVNIGTLTGSGGINGTVTLNIPASVDLVALGVGAIGTLDVTSSKNTLTTSTLIVGNTAPGNGTLNISGGGVVTDPQASIGLDTGAVGSVTVSGSGSQWLNSGLLEVGQQGRGTLSIQTGAVVTSINASVGEFSGSSGTVTVSGKGAQWNDSGVVAVGSGGQGTLTVSSGGVASSAGATIAQLSGSVGNVTVTGSGSQWNDSGGLQVSVGGQATLTVEAGGVVNSGGSYVGATGGRGAAAVTGAGSQWNTTFLELGIGGPGTLTIASGGVVNSINGGGGGVIGTFGGTGAVTVTGTGSQWNLPFLEVGTGDGMLTIQNAGVVNSGGTSIGTFTGSNGTATVSGIGSQWITSSLCVGCSGPGALTAGSGAAGVGPLDIGVAAGVSGTATLTDTGTSWTASGGQVTVGDAGIGTLTVENGAVLTDSVGVIGNQVGSTGTVLVTGAGSTWNNTANLNVGINGTGTLTVQNGGLVTAGTLLNPGTIDIGTHGMVDAKGGTLQGNIVDDGVLDPLGTASIIGDFTLNPDGSLSLDVAGTGSGQYGVLAVSDQGTFDGTLSLDFIDGFAPLKGDTFVFIDDSGVANFNFVATDILGLEPGFQYSENFANGQFTLTALNNGISTNGTPEPATILLLASGLAGVLWYAPGRRLWPPVSDCLAPWFGTLRFRVPGPSMEGIAPYRSRA